MNKIKDKLLKALANIGLWSAKIAANSASAPFLYQPKEPEALKKLKK